MTDKDFADQVADIAMDTRDRLDVHTCIVITFGRGTAIAVSTSPCDDEVTALDQTHAAIYTAVEALLELIDDKAVTTWTASTSKS